uniref:Non-structural protein 2 n=1 Tax=Rotavirus X (isolate RVX/Human/Bangladesh/NADRV-B219/2002/GXP[X]) TaxID=348136 RepID=NSP2_ROTB2|nr:RecName: Full=Non-structural protein 2; Short=NSP2; AltName: Full=NCVP3; AltName: Full=Non-structural RNA-binding protein 35; Short=NS35 [Human rotavirus B219]ABA60395.1 non-structural protein NSP2 [Human rotavirus B219]
MVSIKVSLADFIVKTDEGWIPSDNCPALDRFKTKTEKELLDSIKREGADRASIRKQLFLTPISNKRLTQIGGVPVRDIRTSTTIPSSTRNLITDWLLNIFNDEESGEEVENAIASKYPDIFCSADKISRVAQRLENRRDRVHEDGFRILSATMLAIDSDIATEGKCEIVRATEDAIIAKFEPVSEHLCIGNPRGVFYKAFPIKKEQPMVYGIKALLGISNRDFIMNHGHGHLRTVPYSEINNAIRSFAKKNEAEIKRIRSDSLSPNAGEKFINMCDMLLQKEKIETIIAKIMKNDKN